MDNDTFFKAAAIVSPFLAAGLTYYLTLRTKKNEYLYQNRIPAFKEVARELIELQKYCIGKIAYHEGNQYSPFLDPQGSALVLHSNLTNVRLLNGVFLSSDSKRVLDALDRMLVTVCRAEQWLLKKGETKDPALNLIEYEEVYPPALGCIENCLDVLYKEIGLPAK